VHCCVCLRLATSNDDNAHELLLCLVERLGHEQEVGWLDSLAQELVGCCDLLLEQSMMVGCWLGWLQRLRPAVSWCTFNRPLLLTAVKPPAEVSLQQPSY